MFFGYKLSDPYAQSGIFLPAGEKKWFRPGAVYMEQKGVGIKTV